MDKNFHLDKRAAGLADTLPGSDDELLDTHTVAKLLGVSNQWLEIGRSKGYGPPFIRIGARSVRYRRDSLRSWLNERAEYRCTREYA